MTMANPPLADRLIQICGGLATVKWYTNQVLDSMDFEHERNYH